MKNDIEDERRLLDRTVDKLQREVSVLESTLQLTSNHSNYRTRRVGLRLPISVGIKLVKCVSKICKCNLEQKKKEFTCSPGKSR